MEPKQAYEILKSSKANLEDNVKQALLDVIKSDPEYARYAKVIEERWKEAEEYIKMEPYQAYSRNLVIAIRDVYLGNSTKLDLSKVSAEEWKQATCPEPEQDDEDQELSERFQELYENPTKDNVIYIIHYIIKELDGFVFPVRDIDIEDLCSFGNISFVLWDWPNLINNINYIIENNIQFNEAISTDGSDKGVVPLNFQDILEPVSPYYFDNWRGGESIEAGDMLVKLCDHLGVKVETMAESPAEWNLVADDFSDFCLSSILGQVKQHDPKKIISSFARLFSKPMIEWYPSFFIH